MKEIYLDHAASTPLDKDVLVKMLPYMTEVYGNPSSVHGFGRKMHKALEQSRRSIATALHCRSEEIYFVSGGTEANNWALEGIMTSYGKPGDHLIVSEIEHPAVLNKAKELMEKGFEVSFVKSDEKGCVTLEAIKALVNDKTILISVMMVNNETGSYQDIKEIVDYAKSKNILVHTDGVQALSHRTIDLKALNVDLFSFSGHKINGPVGIGGLYIKAGTKIKSLLIGGPQERSRRAGTSSSALAVGLSEALVKRNKNMPAYHQMITDKKMYFYQHLKEAISDIIINGQLENSHPGIINLRFPNVKAEALLMNLDLMGIAVSSGSACASGALSGSHVLLAMGLTEAEAKSSIRFSFGEMTTFEELDHVIQCIKDIVLRLRGK